MVEDVVEKILDDGRVCDKILLTAYTKHSRNPIRAAKKNQVRPKYRGGVNLQKALHYAFEVHDPILRI